MKRIFIIFCICLLVGSLNAEDLPLNYQLPIAIEDERFIVYQTLGIPNEIISLNTPNIGDDWPKEKTIEYFYKNGLVVLFWNDIVYRIVVNNYGSYKGWEDYTGMIINEVTLKDDRYKVIKKLGKPFIMKTDPIYKTDSDGFGFPRYSNSYYTWLTGEYRIEIEVANTDQVIDSKNNIIRPQDGINTIAITENKK